MSTKHNRPHPWRNQRLKTPKRCKECAAAQTDTPSAAADCAICRSKRRRRKDVNHYADHVLAILTPADY